MAPLIAIVFGWIAMSLPASALPPEPAPLLAYAYDSPAYDAPDNDSAQERGPPASPDLYVTYDSVDLRSDGASAPPETDGGPPATTYNGPGRFAQIAGAGATTSWPSEVAWTATSSLESAGVAAKGVSGLSDDVVGLATRNITNSGDTVLGHFPGYITRANLKGASYFDIGDAWNGLTPSQRWAANAHFLDTRIAAGERVLLSVPKGDIRPGSYLAQEVQYLTSNGYRWTNQWSLVPRG